MTTLSPFAPASLPELPIIAGVRLAALACGIKYKNRNDVMVAELAPGTTVAGVFTRSLTASANIDWGRRCLPHGEARVLVVNSGNSNAFNGRSGMESVERISAKAAEVFGCKTNEVYPCATGVIGQPLPDHLIVNALESGRAQLRPDAWEEAARAIMTTDTFPKVTTRTAVIDGRPVHINGFTKGSGMIAPDMATMLAYIFTDAAIPAPVLQALFSPMIDRSFNSITVDSDTSTSDTALLFATGQAGNKLPASADDALLADFKVKLQEVLIELAQLIVKDGEGATKFVAVRVKGAESERAARRIGLSVANSPLVKTAIAGEDANWGRIVAAIGKSGERADRDLLSIAIGGVDIVINGQLKDDYDETPVAKHMKGREIAIDVNIGIGNGEATIWTCDLTHEYITINGDYRS